MPREIWSIQLEFTLKQALAQISTIEKRLQSIETRFRQMKIGVDPKATTKLNTALNKVGTTATQNTNKVKGLFANLKSDFSDFGTVFARRVAFTFAAIVETAIIGAILSIPAAFALAIRAGASFEDAMLRTATVASGGLEGMTANFVVLEAAARNFAVTTTFGATEVANAMFEMVSSGISTTETITAMSAVINFAGASMTDLGTSVDIMTQIMKSFDFQASDMAEIADILVVALNKTTLNVERLQNALRFAAPAGGAFSQSLEDTVIVMSVFVDATKQGGIAGRAFRFALAALADTTPKAEAVIERLGLSLEKLNPTTNSIIDIFERFAGTTVTASEVLQIFGRRSGPVVALAIERLRKSMLDVNEATGETTNLFRELQDNMAEGKKIEQARIQYARFMESTSSQFKLLKATGEEALLRIFDSIRGVTNAFIGMVQAVVANNEIMDLFMFATARLTTLLTLLMVRLGVGGLVAVFKAVRVAAAGATAGVTVFGTAVGVSASVATGGLILVLFALVEILTRLFTESNLVERSIRLLGELFGVTGGAAEEAASQFGVVSASLDLLKLFGNRVTITLARIAILYEFAAAASDNWTRSLLGLQKVQRDGTGILERVAKFSRLLIDTLEDENEQLTKNFGMRTNQNRLAKERLDALRHEVFEMDKKLGMEGRLAELLEEVGETEFKIIQQMGEKIIALQEEIRFFGLSEAAILRLKAAKEDIGEVEKDFLLRQAKLIGQLDAMNAKVKQEEQRIKDLAAAFKALLPQEDKAIKFTNQFRLVLVELGKQGIKLTEIQLLALSAQLAEYELLITTGAIPAGSALAAQLRGMRAILESLAGDLELVTTKVITFTSETKKVVPFLEAVEQRLRDAFNTKTTQEFAEEIEEIEKLFVALQRTGFMATGAVEELQERMLLLAGEMADAGEDGVQLEVMLRSLANTLGVELPEGAESWIEALGLMGEKTEDVTSETVDLFEDMFDNLTTGMGQALGKMIFETESFGEFMKTFLQGTLKSIIADGFNNLLQAGLKALQGLAETGFNPLQLAITGVALAISGLIKLFGSDEVDEIIQDFDNLGTLSKDLAKKIDESIDSTGRWVAEVRFLGEIMDDVGVTVFNFSGFVAKLFNVLQAMDQHVISGAEGVKVLDTAFTELMERMTELGIVGDATVIAFIRDLRERGLEVASVIKFVDDNMRSAAAGLEQVFKVALITTQEELDRLGRMALAVFNEMIANGSSAAEAFEALGPALDILIDRLAGQKTTNKLLKLGEAILESGEFAGRAANRFLKLAKSLGEVPREGESFEDFVKRLQGELVEVDLKGSKALRELLKFRKLVDQNKDLVDSFTGLNDILLALANTGTLNARGFKDLQEQAIEMRKQLKDAGFSGAQSLAMMAPFLMNIRDLARQFGFEIDENTQALIDEAEAMGLLEEEATVQNVLTEGFERVTIAINRLIETMGGIPVAFEDAADAANDFADETEDALDDINRAVSESMDDMVDSAWLAANGMNMAFSSLEQNLVGNTVFRNIKERGAKFLNELVPASGIVADMMNKNLEGVQFGVAGATFDVGGPGARLPGFNPTAQFNAPQGPLSPQESRAQGDRSATRQPALSRFEKKNLALLGIIANNTGKRGGNRKDVDLFEELREASLNGSIEINVDAVSRLN